jgi:branched-chain amino acid transport system substrate-binding protein
MPGAGVRVKAVVGALLAAVLGVGSGFVSPSGAAVPAASSNVLGTKNPAKGTPVKIGFITDDRSPRGDNSIETPVANATTKWLNQYMRGVGGHPIELVRCVSAADPSTSTDCASEMIAQDVAAVVVGANSVIGNIWAPLNQAGIPVFLFGSSSPDLVADTDTTFIMTNGRASLFALPAGVAKENKAKKVSAVVVDIPAATNFWKEAAPALYKEAGLAVELMAIAGGTADMTPQMQQLVKDNPKGVAFVLGGDAFCIAAFNGLRAAGFKGTIAAVPFCISDATRTAVPGDFLEGIQIAATSPSDDPKNPSMKQYFAVLDKFGASDADKTNTIGQSMFMALSGLSVATQKLKGAATPKSIAAAAKAMDWSVLPGAGGTHIRCNGKADPAQPAVCTNSVLAAELNAQGRAATYTPLNDERIPD